MREVEVVGNEKTLTICEEGSYIRSTYCLRLTEEEIARLKNGEILDRVVFREPINGITVETCVSVLVSPAGHQEPTKI
jgi:hypothetical protein